jgi:hypothetical protein
MISLVTISRRLRGFLIKKYAVTSQSHFMVAQYLPQEYKYPKWPINHDTTYYKISGTETLHM